MTTLVVYEDTGNVEFFDGSDLSMGVLRPLLPSSVAELEEGARLAGWRVERRRMAPARAR